MEDQKLLWIVFSVVLFAVVVLASVLYFLKPKGTEPALAASGAAPTAGFDTYEYVRGSSPALPVETPQPAAGTDLQIVVGEEPLPAPSGETTPVTPAARTAQQVAPASAPTSRPAAAKPAAAAPAATTARAAPKASVKTAPAPAPSQPTRVYWIQTASFKSRTGAEAMVATLAESGVTGRVQVGDVGGQPYYRVRVGPYTSRDEADKFLSWIRGVRGLEQSYISVVNRGNE
jgi:DedD protein